MPDTSTEVTSTSTRKFKKLPKNPAVVVLLVIISIIVLCGLCCAGLAVVAQFIPPELRLESHDSNTWTAENPKEKVQLYCGELKELSINDEKLSEEDRKKLCGDEGYELSLVDGENKFTFAAIGTNDKESTLEITISFDENRYQDRLAKQEESNKQAEADQKAREAEEAAQKEEEEKAKAEADAKILNEWKQRYADTKKNLINPSISKSDEMIDAFSNGTDPYQTRNLANNYKEYFRSTCNANLEDKMNPNPDSVKEHVKNLNSYYSDFCMYNEFLAMRVVDYFEADSTSDQYEHLDMINYYTSLVIESKTGLNANILLLDQTKN